MRALMLRTATACVWRADGRVRLGGVVHDQGAVGKGRSMAVTGAGQGLVHAICLLLGACSVHSELIGFIEEGL
jgi:hypothetical protein